MTVSTNSHESGGIVFRRSCNYKYRFQFFNGARAKTIRYFITTDTQMK